MKTCAMFALCLGTAFVIRGASTPEVPFSVVENHGQAAEAALFVGQGAGVRMEFGAHTVLVAADGPTLHIDFNADNPGLRPEAEQATGARINYLTGSDSSRWRTGLTAFGAVRYRGVWPGVDVLFRAEGPGVRPEFHLGAGGKAASVSLRVEGEARVQGDGSLIVGEVVIPAPRLFTGFGVVEKELTAAWQPRGGGTVGLETRAVAAALSTVSRSQPFVISGYFGGTSQENITAVAVTTSFNIVVAGWTSSSDLAANGVRRSSGGGVDAFVAAFTPMGGQLIYCTYLGGSGDDRAFGLAVDQAQNAYVTGWTSSANFPVVGGVQNRLSGSRDAFVTKINPAGTALVYSTYLGGSGVDSAQSLALDSSNGVVIAGDTTSTNLPFSAGARQQRLAGGQDVFLARINAAGNAITALTWLGGSAQDRATVARFDPSGNILVAGGTFSADYPATTGTQTRSGGGQDGFVSSLTGDLRTLRWSTYLGGAGGSSGAPEIVNGMIVGTTGVSLTVVGTTSSTNFPMPGLAYQPTYGGGQTDGFFARLSNSNGVLARATYFGGSGDDGFTAISNDGFTGNYVAGYTSSDDLPILRAAQGSPAGGMDAFAIKIWMASDGSMQMGFSTRIGGSGNDSANAIATDSLTNAVVVGSTTSSDFPVAGSLSRSRNGLMAGFITKIGSPWTTAVASAPTVYFDPWRINGFNGSTPVVNSATFGQSGDVIVMGDWTGSGVYRMGAFRSGRWLLDTNGDGLFGNGDQTIIFGTAGDIPLFGFWDGTGRPGLGLFRAGTFILDLSGRLTGTSTGVSDAQFTFGQAGDVPVVGDWNGSGATQVGIFRNGTWRLDVNGDRALTAADPTYTFGRAGDLPITGDWRGSGQRTQIGVYRAGFWILDQDGNGVMDNPGVNELYFAFGGPTLRPLVW